MSPYEHGEVFVTDDGAETDLDLGHYERFIDENLTKNCSITSGMIYQNVINRERRGDYLGKTVQVIPHITNEIKENIYSFEDQDIDVVITELGGTVGDIESLAFIEAIRQVGLEKPLEDVAYIHVTLLPFISGSNEIKSKPTQHSVKELQSLGIKPDILVCRSEIPIPENIREKLALFCNVRKEDVIANLTASNLYEVPLMLEKEGLADQICKKLQLEKTVPHNELWEQMIENIRKNNEQIVTIGIVGKYVRLEDAYLSVAESIHHAGYSENVKTKIKYIDCETVTKENAEDLLKDLDGIIVPGGFGNRGIEGKINTVEYARTSKIPFLGICLGMQMAVAEFARNVLGYSGAISTEFDEITNYPVIHIMENQKGIDKKGGTMRLGSYPCVIKEDSLAYKLYGVKEISERHRHRYEYNNAYKEEMENAGLICSGTSPNGELVEIVELKNHPFFIASQFHPEFKSRPDHAAPLFKGLVNAAKLRIN